MWKRKRPPLEKLNSIWGDYHTCLICDEKGADAWHHIISGSNPACEYDGCEGSVYNFAPIHNFSPEPDSRCHIDNYKLSERETTEELLQKVKEYIDITDYQPDEKDKRFLDIYSQFYS